jgi:hypothetical protein
MGLTLGLAVAWHVGHVQKITPRGGEAGQGQQQAQARGAGCYLLRWRWANNPLLALALPSKYPGPAGLSVYLYLLLTPPAQ